MVDGGKFTGSPVPPGVHSGHEQIGSSGTRDDLRKVVTSAVPVYLSMLVTVLASAIDSVVLGRFDTAALATFAVLIGLYGPSNAAITGAVRGVLPFVAECRDGPARDLAARLRDGIVLAVTVGALGAVVVASAPLIARTAGVSERMTSGMGPTPYLLAAALIVNSVGVVATFCLTGLGHARLAMRAGFAAAAVSVLLSPSLVLGLAGLPRLGLPGAGVAMLSAVTVNAVVAWVGLARVVGPGPLERRPDLRQVVRMARVGVPTAASVLIKFGILGYVAFVAARRGPVTAASHNVGDSLVRLTFTAAVAVGLAVVSVVAVRVAAGDRDGVRRGVLSGVWLVLAVLGLLATVLVVRSGDVVRLYTTDPAVRELVASVVPLVAVAVLLDGTQAVLGFGLTALKRTGPSLVMFAVCYGSLALSAEPVARRSGLAGLWGGLALANLLLVAGQFAAFWWASARLRSTPGAGPVVR
jgi:MATE family, multidrug efflux pump